MPHIQGTSTGSSLARCLPEASYRIHQCFKVRRLWVSSRFIRCEHPAVLQNGIHFTDRSNKLSGIPFEATHAPCDPYWALEVDSMPTVSTRSRTLLRLNHSSQTSATCVVYSPMRPRSCCTSLFRRWFPSITRSSSRGFSRFISNVLSKYAETLHLRGSA